MSKRKYIILQGDCLEMMKGIPAGSVDLVLADPPYGKMKGAPLDGWKRKGDCAEWDVSLPIDGMLEQINQVLRPNGKAILFSQEPYTSTLVKSTIPSLPFAYRAIWYKNVHANALLAKKAMVSRYEDICIFSKIVREETTDHPLRTLFLSELQKSGKTKIEAVNLIGSSATHYFTDGLQFRMPTKEKFDALSKAGFISVDYEECAKINKDYLTERYSRITKETPSVFNLWEGYKSKANVLEYAKDNDGYHPTQKPVKLLEDLIQTFSNAGDTILDFAMGSGSTGVACMNTGRRFIGMELDLGYFEIAKKRIEEAEEKGGVRSG